jgi:hypothetical protein
MSQEARCAFTRCLWAAVLPALQGDISQDSKDLGKRSTLDGIFVKAREQGTGWDELVFLVGVVPVDKVEE